MRKFLSLLLALLMLPLPGGSYYVLDPAAVAQTVNAYCNPYEKELTADDLQIRQG